MHDDFVITVVVVPVAAVDPDEDPPVLADPEVVAVPVVSVDPNEDPPVLVDPPVEPVEMVDPEVVDTLMVADVPSVLSVEMVPAVEEGSEDTEVEASVDETTVVTTSGSIWQA